ncbi:class I SAM-dependent methyltransferase [Cutibacterium avidum]|uniref:class I SAM-dependent methyltransferase n=1 Tax=Cutibacterium avidum TaxID=33010 RepID=UPI00192CB8E2|nr:class I SAM-dependent methyltransferase [Cutibacterium avidum]QQY15473.1 class I SAM-dependent methyltransferase [Cutibacterium avidum]
MPTPNDRPKTPQSLFTRLAGSYDRINTIASLGRDMLWRRQALALVQNLPPGDTWDLCCGTGAMGQVIKRRFPDAQLYGADCNQAMLDQCQSTRRGIYQSLSRSPADNLPCHDGSAGLVTLSLGFNDLNDQEATLREIRRILAPDGTFLSLELGLPARGIKRAAYRTFLTTLITIRNRLGLAEIGHLLDEIVATPPNDHLVHLITAQGFAHKKYTQIAGGIMYANLFTASKDNQ